MPRGDSGKHVEGGQRVHHSGTQNAPAWGYHPRQVPEAALIRFKRYCCGECWDLPCILRLVLGF